jgi:plasmid stabilization system protein ParE
VTETLASLPIHVNTEATADVKRAIRFYNQRVLGLGRAFLHELAEQIRRIQQFPRGYPRIDASRRRATLSRFPYTVVYRISETRIDIIGVFDCRADPVVLASRQ